MPDNWPIPLHATQPRKRLAQNFRFIAQLQFVRNMLVVASAADPEIGARRDRSVRRRCLDFGHPAADEFLARLQRLDGYVFIRQDKGSKDGVAFVMCEALPSINQLLDAHFDWVSHRSSSQLR